EWKETPHSCRIICASRGALHRSVAKPCSVGLSPSQRRTIFSWAVLSFGGRWPAAPPGPPRRRKAATQRRTLRASTAQEVGDLLGGVPSWARWTARQRLASNVAGEPLVLMAENKAKPTPIGHYLCRSH